MPTKLARRYFAKSLIAAAIAALPSSALAVAWNATDSSYSDVNTSPNGLSDNYGLFTNESLIVNSAESARGTTTYLGNGWFLTAHHVVEGSGDGLAQIGGFGLWGPLGNPDQSRLSNAATFHRAFNTPYVSYPFLGINAGQNQRLINDGYVMGIDQRPSRHVAAQHPSQCQHRCAFSVDQREQRQRLQ